MHERRLPEELSNKLHEFAVIFNMVTKESEAINVEEAIYINRTDTLCLFINLSLSTLRIIRKWCNLHPIITSE
jgi:hypothetical protein